MGIKNIFKRNKYLTVEINLSDDVELNCKEKKPNIPNGMWFKCEQCGKAIYKKDMEKSYMTCEECGSHFRLGALDRINITLDQGTFEEFDKDMTSKNPLGFPCYEEKVKKLVESTKINEAIITGTGKINGIRTAIGVMDSNFMMGSMGSVVGEKLTRLFEKSRELKLPVIVFTASGGARMQEGMFSLMQMAKVSAAVAKHNNEGLLYIVVLTDPTTGGVTASFAMLGDIILAEPGSLIGFAGKRVIEQTIKQELPKEFQKSEFLLDKGFVDSIVHRKDLRDTLYNILKIHM